MATGVLYAPVLRPYAAMECVCKVCTALVPAASYTGAGHKGRNLYSSGFLLISLTVLFLIELATKLQLLLSSPQSYYGLQVLQHTNPVLED